MTKTDKMNDEPDAKLQVAAAADGDYEAIRELAAWYRRRNRPADGSFWELSDEQIAFQVENFGFELEVRRVQARQLRRLLALLPKQPLAFGPIVHPKKKLLEDHASAFGLPLIVWAGRPSTVVGASEPRMVYGGGITDAETREYLLIAPTDGHEEGETRAAILAFFARSFSSGLIDLKVDFFNHPLSQAGEDVRSILGLHNE